MGGPEGAWVGEGPGSRPGPKYVTFRIVLEPGRGSPRPEALSPPPSKEAVGCEDTLARPQETYQGPPSNPTGGYPNLAQLCTTAQFYRQDALPASNPTHLGAHLAQLRTTLQ